MTSWIYTSVFFFGAALGRTSGNIFGLDWIPVLMLLGAGTICLIFFFVFNRRHKSRT